jgi:putative peptide zinc metalloprotease protein
MSIETRPKLRRHLHFTRHEKDGASSWVIKDPSTLRYFRVAHVEGWLMQQMNGTQSVQALSDTLYTKIGMRAAPGAIELFVRRLAELELVESSMQEDGAMQRVRRKPRLPRESRNTILRCRWSFGDPDALFERMVQAMPFFWTRWFVIASCFAFILYGVLLSLHWRRFASSFAALYSPGSMTIDLLLIAFGALTGIAIIHEFAHGLTCKRFGGEVREIGAMLLYFMPAFYCNVSDAWMFESRARRLWVTVAGGWMQLWCATLATVIWLVSEPGSFVNTAALVTGALGGGVTLLFNYNPLLATDGYYALVDWLGMPNLRIRAFAYVGMVLRRRALRLDVQVPTVTNQERVIFLTCGILSGLYSVLMLGLFILLVA